MHRTFYSRWLRLGAPLLVLTAAMAGCAAPDPKRVAEGTTAHDREEPVTGSMLRRNRDTSNVRTVDADSVRDGSRGSTGARSATGSGPQ